MKISVSARVDDLKREYALALSEWEISGEEELWDETAGDGLEPQRETSEEKVMRSAVIRAEP